MATFVEIEFVPPTDEPGLSPTLARPSRHAGHNLSEHESRLPMQSSYQPAQWSSSALRVGSSTN